MSEGTNTGSPPWTSRGPGPAPSRSSSLSEQSYEAPEQDEPVVDASEVAPEEGTSDEGFDSPVDLNAVPEEYREHVSQIEKQFKSAYTRKTQELAEQRKTYEAAQEQLSFIEQLQNDPETQLALLRQLAEVHGYDIEGDDDEGEADATLGSDSEEEFDFRDPRVDALLAEREAAQQQAEWDAYVAGVEEYIESQFESLAKEAGRELSDEEKDLVVSYAVSMDLDGQGRPQIGKAFEQLRRIEAGWQTRWIESKKAPHVSGDGVPGSERVDLSKSDKRVNRMMQIVEQAQRSDN
jgi:hypothetical protein